MFEAKITKVEHMGVDGTLVTLDTGVLYWYGFRFMGRREMWEKHMAQSGWQVVPDDTVPPTVQLAVKLEAAV